MNNLFRKNKSANKLKYLLLIIPAAIIVFGMVVIIQPYFKAWQFDKLQKAALGEWERAIKSGEISPSGGVSGTTRGWETASVFLGGSQDNEEGVWEENTNPKFTVDYVLNNMDGVITIEKMDYRAAILKKATKNNLDISICSVIPERRAGAVGNYVLAGHNSRIYGRHLSRLVEVEIGDLITVEDAFGEYKYKVTEIFSVAPDQTWVMEDSADKKIITLITCDYANSPADRYIVRGEMIE